MVYAAVDSNDWGRADAFSINILVAAMAIGISRSTVWGEILSGVCIRVGANTTASACAVMRLSSERRLIMYKRFKIMLSVRHCGGGSVRVMSHTCLARFDAMYTDAGSFSDDSQRSVALILDSLRLCLKNGVFVGLSYFLATFRNFLYAANGSSGSSMFRILFLSKVATSCTEQSCLWSTFTWPLS
mmetsp:Transcript_31996/g.51008  ORF Transcript_31996/g.51008 Transcript_31996/m.51008 type:complete len:186 (-) Transcript_31996:1394-1951(-)